MAFNDTLFQLGMDLTRSSTAQKEDHCVVAPVTRTLSAEAKAEAGTKVSGRNLFIDLHGTQRLDGAKMAERALKTALLGLGKRPESVVVSAKGDGTLSGVAVLETGRLSFQANPKSGFAAIDVSGCAGLDPHAAMFALCDAFKAREAAIQTSRRASDVVFLPAVRVPQRARAKAGRKAVAKAA